MSRYIAKYMNLKKSKRPTFWNGGSTNVDRIKTEQIISKFLSQSKWTAGLSAFACKIPKFHCVVETQN